MASKLFFLRLVYRLSCPRFWVLVFLCGKNSEGRAEFGMGVWERARKKYLKGYLAHRAPAPAPACVLCAVAVPEGFQRRTWPAWVEYFTVIHGVYCCPTPRHAVKARMVRCIMLLSQSGGLFPIISVKICRFCESLFHFYVDGKGTWRRAGIFFVMGKA